MTKDILQAMSPLPQLDHITERNILEKCKRRAIFSRTLAQLAIKAGCPVLGMEENRLDPSKTVYFFEKTPVLDNVIEQYQQMISRAKETM